MRLLAIAMFLVIVVLGAATVFFVTGMTREVRSLVASVGSLQRIATADDEPAATTGNTRPFVVVRGDTAASIADRLEREGFIKDALAFRVRARGEGVDARFEAGEYQLSPTMRPSEIMVALQRGRFAGIIMTVPEGWRIAQIADAVELRVPGSRDELVRQATSGTFDYPFLKDRPAGASLEGYLFPDTYEIEHDMPPRRIVDRMLAAFGERVTPDTFARARARGLSPHELVTLASIVEREARVSAERATIAGVFLNRLKQGMPLQTDPAVQYAIRPTNDPVPEGNYWKRDLTALDLRRDSPYNTYLKRGLPPGPICSPGLASILAVTDSPPTDLLYFVAKPDGSHAFSKTLAEHNANVSKYARGEP